MPVINFSYKDLCSVIGEDVPIEELYERIPMMGAVMESTDMTSDEISVELFPDRADLYCFEGMVR